MKYSTQIKPISYLKNHTAEITKQLSETHEPLLITQNGEAKMVVMDVETFEGYEETLACLKILALGNRQIEKGEYRPAEEVFSEIDNTNTDLT